jgi:hypothetical protein
MVVQSGLQRLKKTLTIAAGFLLMYAGFIILFLPMIISALPPSLTLSNTPQIFDFENDLNSVSSISGNPLVIASPFASGRKVIECQNGDYVRWNLATPSKTMDLTFKIYWTRFPNIVNETLSVGEIWGLDTETWQGIFVTTILCNRYGDRGWNIGTEVPTSYYSPVSSDVVYALEANRWYTIRMTADLNTGTYRLYMDTIELASITDTVIPDDVYIDFFRLGAGARGTSDFITYYDDVTVSLLDPSPPGDQWSVRITSSPGGSTNPQGAISVNHGENLTATAIHITGYVFSKWILDGTGYSTNSTFILPTQSVGTQHTLHAMFRRTGSELNNWLPLQIIGVGIIGGGGYLLWSQNKRHSSKSFDRKG